MATEVKVGILFLVVVLLAIVVGVYLSDVTARWGTYRVVAHFKDVKGLASGADVQLSGVNVGKVLTVQLQRSDFYPGRLVRVEMAIKKQVPLYQTDDFVIDQGTLLGDRLVSVQRLPEEALELQGLNRGSPLVAGQEITGGELVGFTTLADNLEDTRQKLNTTLATLQDTYAGPQIKQAIQELLTNVNRASLQAQTIATATLRLVARLDRTMAQNEGAVQRIVTNIDAASAGIRSSVEKVEQFLTTFSEGPLPGQLTLTLSNIRQASEDIKVAAEAARGLLADPENQRRLEQTLASVDATAANLERVTRSVQDVVGDPQVQENLKVSLANLRESTENLRQVTEASRQIMTNAENLRAISETLRNVQEGSAGAVEVVHRANLTLERVDRTMAVLSDVASAVQPSQVTGRFSLDQTGGSAMRGDVNVDFVWGGDPASYWRVGVRGVGRKNTLNLQRGVPLGGPWSARLGLFDSRLGGALDYQASPSLRWEAELWDLEQQHLDLRSLWDVGGDWRVRAGVYGIGEENDPFIGLERDITLGGSR